MSAPTGATKTLTAFLAILNELVGLVEKDALEDRVYCIYVSPLRALNYDIEHNLKQPLVEMSRLAGKKLGIRVAVRTGDTSQSERTKMLEKPPHILITTPESLAIALNSPRFGELLNSVDWFIVDEIHALAENKRGVHLSLSLERLAARHEFARIGLSATIAPLEEVAALLVGQNRSCLIADVQFFKQMDLKVICPMPNLIESSHESMQSALYRLLDQLIQKHRTTLIFTNTRSATERVVHHLKESFPQHYIENIGAHHGSLSKGHRRKIEAALREGKLKVVVCSTSLELGIDIGYIDLVVLLGSPKSVARGLQRIGRSGHQLSATTKGRIVVLDRDDLVECALLLKSALEKRIDHIHIPKNCLDVLAQQLYGIALAARSNVEEVYELVRRSYCFTELPRKDFDDVLAYLAGAFVSLENRHIYAKIWYDQESGMLGRRGRLGRVIYMTNIGTIPDEAMVEVKMGDRTIGFIEEAFLERLRPRDIFVLGGDCYRFKFSRGMTAQVEEAHGKKPTVPSWFSDMLPLSFDLALQIAKFRRLIDEKFRAGRSKAEIMAFINNYLYVDVNAAAAIYDYMQQQWLFSEGLIPHDKRLVIERYAESTEKEYAIFHTMLGRRANDCLARAVAFAISRLQHRDVELGVSDNGFFVSYRRGVRPLEALRALRAKELRVIAEQAIEQTEILKRRFRHCAVRSLMILRSYLGRTKRVGRQQLASTILLNAVRRISNNFPILKEARREVLEDLMDVEKASWFIQQLEADEIEVREFYTRIPSPFAFNLVLQGHLDILKAEDRQEFLRRMHSIVMAKIGMKKRLDDTS